VPAFALDLFERQAEVFLRARIWREWQFLTGQRPGRGLVSLYDQDFPNFTSTDFWADLQAATPDDPRQFRALSALLATAYMEGRTREFSTSVTRVEASATVNFGDRDIPWREARAHWAVLPEVPRRHEIEDSWRGILRSDLNPTLERWHEALRAQLQPLGGSDWLTFWSALRPLEFQKLAESLLQTTEDIYANGMGVYLAQLDLPIDDVWVSDVEWAFRAPRFDAIFPELTRMPGLIRALRDLGVELPEQTNVRLEYVTLPWVRCLPLDVPDEVHVLQRLGGGWRDYSRSLQGLGMAEHLAHTDPKLRFWERWLGDDTSTIGYGLLLEGVTREKTWLTNRLDYAANDDYRVIAHLAWLYRVRRTAAMALYEQRLWASEPGTSMAADFEESLTAATRVRHFPDDYLQVMFEAPWSTLGSATWLRAEVFSSQVRAYLKREFDAEWWRSNRAARFIKDELWRPGRRHTAEELLGFMGYEGFDAAILSAEFEEVLRPL
jgi:hypothetical protein